VWTSPVGELFCAPHIGADGPEDGDDRAWVKLVERSGETGLTVQASFGSELPT
jgi:hypothetical protein